MLTFRFVPLDETRAREVLRWTYDPPYDVYNVAADDASIVASMVNPDNHYDAVLQGDALAGFCCIGPDARVRGYLYDDAAVDLGAGMRPDMTGRGYGRSFMTAIVRHAETQAAGLPLRATIAAFNTRALRVVRDLAFLERARFRRDDGTEFVVLLREAD